MSAIKLDEVNFNIKKISSKYFSKALANHHLNNEINISWFVDLTKSVNFYLYQTFGDETEIRTESEIDENARVLKEWFTKGLILQDKALRETIESEEEYQDHVRRVKEDSDYANDFLLAKLTNLSEHFASALTEYILSKYVEKMDVDSQIVYKPNVEMIEEYKKNGDKEKLKKALIVDFNKFFKTSGINIPKGAKKELIKKIYKDIKSIKEGD